KLLDEFSVFAEFGFATLVESLSCKKSYLRAVRRAAIASCPFLIVSSTRADLQHLQRAKHKEIRHYQQKNFTTGAMKDGHTVVSSRRSIKSFHDDRMFVLIRLGYAPMSFGLRDDFHPAPEHHLDCKQRFSAKPATSPKVRYSRNRHTSPGTLSLRLNP